MNHIQLQQGDITQAEVDAIVNAANPQMLGGGGVDGAIHRAAGPELLAACRKVKAEEGIRCPTGQARITHAGNLKARYVIHTVGPVYRESNQPQILLANAYQNSMALAMEYKCHSIAFPAISCGVYGYPLAEAAQIALTVCGSDRFCSLDVRFYLFDKPTLEVWEAVLKNKIAGFR